MPPDLRLITDPATEDELEQRVVLESLCEGALAFGDKMAAAIGDGDLVTAAMWAVPFSESSRSIRRLRALMRLEHS